MAVAKQQTCEAKVDGAWLSATLAEARGKYGMARKRCPVCHGQVITTGSYYAEAITVAFQHRRKHDGCPQLPAQFRGTPSLHPLAMV